MRRKLQKNLQKFLTLLLSSLREVSSLKTLRVSKKTLGVYEKTLLVYVLVLVYVNVYEKKMKL